MQSVGHLRIWRGRLSYIALTNLVAVTWIARCPTGEVVITFAALSNISEMKRVKISWRISQPSFLFVHTRNKHFSMDYTTVSVVLSCLVLGQGVIKSNLARGNEPGTKL